MWLVPDMRIATGSTLSATTRGGKNLVLEKKTEFLFLNLNKLETEPLCLSIWDSKRVVYERIAGGWGREKRSVENLEYFFQQKMKKDILYLSFKEVGRHFPFWCWHLICIQISRSLRQSCPSRFNGKIFQNPNSSLIFLPSVQFLAICLTRIGKYGQVESSQVVGILMC